MRCWNKHPHRRVDQHCSFERASGETSEKNEFGEAALVVRTWVGDTSRFQGWSSESKSKFHTPPSYDLFRRRTCCFSAELREAQESVRY